MATQKKWISDRQELITLMKERGNNIRYPYQYFPYDYKINYYLRKKIIAKIKEINEYDPIFKIPWEFTSEIMV